MQGLGVWTRPVDMRPDSRSSSAWGQASWLCLQLCLESTAPSSLPRAAVPAACVQWGQPQLCLRRACLARAAAGLRRCREQVSAVITTGPFPAPKAPGSGRGGSQDAGLSGEPPGELLTPALPRGGGRGAHLGIQTGSCPPHLCRGGGGPGHEPLTVEMGCSAAHASGFGGYRRR